MPPAKSGIADYSAALLDSLRGLADVDVIEAAPPTSFNSSAYDALLYQIGNNGYHAAAYETAIKHPGIVVLHESNLHHLIAEITIKRGNWDAYMEEVAFDGGPEALNFAKRVRALEVGPDYEGVPMLRRLLANSKGVIVHSHAVESDVRRAGFTGPVAVIPHGAWIPEGDRARYRRMLGLDETVPLIGVFGFLKPYKRIAEALRAFRRVVRLEPKAKMILVGEPHPDFPVARMIEDLGISRHVRLMGFTPIEDFTGYMSACDIILNLRFPTVGESSGSFLRALGLGRAAIVSDIGSFSEYPNEICFKVPVDSREEDVLFEYLNILVSRPEVGHGMGARAKDWVARECNWPSVARRYAEFIAAPANKPTISSEAIEAASAPPPPPVVVEPEYLIGWAANDDAKAYLEEHVTRLSKTLAITPPGGPGKRILEMGAYLQITPSLKTKLGYEDVRGCYYGEPGRVDHRRIASESGEEFTVDIEHFDAERDPFPYEDAFFDTVLCCELIEHLPSDPMFMMSEINRILKPGGHLVLTTPNIISLRGLAAMIKGYHPGFFPAYIRPAKPDEEVEARHNREYTPGEIYNLLLDSGFDVTLIETGPFKEEPQPPDWLWIEDMLKRYFIEIGLRGDGIYAVGRKAGPVVKRYPAWLYQGGE